MSYLKRIQKSLLIVFFAVQTIFIQAQSDTTYTGNITVTTQAEVDTLSTTLAGKTIIDGNLTIGYTLDRDSPSSSNITNLTPLGNIVHITGGVWIQQNGQLVNLTGLDSLQTIGGYFRVAVNYQLTTLGYFPVLQTIEGYFSVFDNAELTTLDFPVLQSIGGYFEVFNNNQLTTLGNFSTLDSIGGYFSVNSNDQLVTLGNFPNLTSIGVGERYLFSLDEFRDSVSIVVESNFNLVLCTVLENFLPIGTHAVIGDIYIQNNATGCETTEEISNPPPVLLVNNRTFSHKDSTTTSFNIYANVRWQLATSDDATWITSLSSDSSTHSSRITGENEATITLIHTRAPNETPRSTTLTLTAIDENDNELTNPATMTINLTQLTFYERDITLSSQEEVNEFISNATVILGNLTIGYTDFGDSRSSNITDLTPLSNMTHITGDLRIQQNGQLDSINDLNNLQTIGGNFGVRGNSQLTTLGDFPALQSIGEFFSVSNNDQLTTLGDFPVLQSIRGFVAVFDNDQLTTLGDFPVLQSIRGFVVVFDNDTLTTLGNFPNLTNIGIGRAWVPSESQVIDNVSIVVENNSSLSDCCVLASFLNPENNRVEGKYIYHQ